jgi:hypothetical protein
MRCTKCIRADYLRSRCSYSRSAGWLSNETRRSLRAVPVVRTSVAALDADDHSQCRHNRDHATPEREPGLHDTRLPGFPDGLECVQPPGSPVSALLCRLNRSRGIAHDCLNRCGNVFASFQVLHGIATHVRWA